MVLAFFPCLCLLLMLWNERQRLFFFFLVIACFSLIAICICSLYLKRKCFMICIHGIAESDHLWDNWRCCRHCTILYSFGLFMLRLDVKSPLFNFFICVFVYFMMQAITARPAWCSEAFTAYLFPFELSALCFSLCSVWLDILILDLITIEKFNEILKKGYVELIG